MLKVIQIYFQSHFMQIFLVRFMNEMFMNEIFIQ